MKNIEFLIILLVWTSLLNIVSVGALWISTKVELYKYLLLAWIVGILPPFILLNIPEAGVYIKVMAFSIFFIKDFLLASILSILLNYTIDKRPYIWLYLCTFILTTIMYKTNIFSSTQVAIPFSIVAGMPSILICSKAIFKDWNRSTMAQKGFILAIFTNGLHNIDYAFLYDDITLYQIGISIAIGIGVALTLFGPGVIIERVMRDKIRLELELKYKAKISYNTKLTALGEMAGGVAHEINNPLASIKFSIDYCKQLMDHPKDGMKDIVMKQFQMIGDQIQKMSVVVKSLLQFASEDGQAPYKKININTLVEKTLYFCQEKFKTHNIAFQIENSYKNLTVLGRESEISQILLNLLNNAFEAVDMEAKKWIKVKVEQVNTDVHISIIDSGQGIPISVREKIFQPFVSTKDIGHGTGLGLSTSKGIANSHGGNLRLISIKDPTIFLLELPLYLEEV